MGKDLKGNKLGKGFGQRKDGLYFYRYTDRFGKRSSPIYNSDLRQLKATAKLLVSQDTLHMSSSDNKITLNELFKQWVDVYMVNDLKESTLKNYKQTYNNYVKDSTLGKTPVSKITVLKVKAFFNEIVNKNLSQSICGTVRCIIIGVLDLAVLENIIFRNDISKLKIKSRKNPKKIEPLTLEEEVLFLQQTKYTYYHNLYKLLFNTGLRIGEALALEVTDIDFKKRLIYVTKTLQHSRSGKFENGSKYMYTSPKNDESRIVPLNKTALEALKDQILQLDLIKSDALHWRCKRYSPCKGFENLVFMSRNGNPIAQSTLFENIKFHVNKINQEYGENTIQHFGLHVTRHTFATRCAENDIPLNIIKDYLGHKDIKMTARVYVNSNVEDYSILEAIDCIPNNNIYNDTKADNLVS